MTDQTIIVTVQGQDSGASDLFNKLALGAAKVGDAHKGAAAGAKEHGKAQNELLNALRETAVAFTLLDGPLGGIASRFRALGTLSKLVSTGILVGITAVVSLAAAMKIGLENSKELELENVKLEAILEATGRTSVGTTAAMAEMAKQISETTLITKEQATAGEELLATFSNIGTDKFKGIIEGAKGLADLNHVDMTSALRAFAKALQDPEKSLDALRRLGVTFTPVQKEMIKNFQETGDLLSAQAPIYARLAQYQQAATAEHHTLAGASHDLSEQFKEFTIALVDDTGISKVAYATLEILAGIFHGLAASISIARAGMNDFIKGVASVTAIVAAHLTVSQKNHDAAMQYAADLTRDTVAINNWVMAGYSFTEAQRLVAAGYREIGDAKAKAFLDSGDQSKLEQEIAAMGEDNKALEKHLKSLKMAVEYKRTDAAVAEVLAQKYDILSQSHNGYTKEQELELKLLNKKIGLLAEIQTYQDQLTHINEFNQETKSIDANIKSLQKRNAELRAEAGGGTKLSGDALSKQLEIEKETDSFRKQQLETQLGLIQANDKLTQQIADQKELMHGLEGAAETAFGAFLKGGKSGKQILYDMTTAMEELLLKMALIQPLGKALEGSSFFSAIGSIFTGGAHAQGNAFENGNVVAFASGGVVSSPTAFPMAGGQTGLMGEAGPEGIFPLTRTADGAMGIRAVGSMNGQSISMPVSVNVNMSGGDGSAASPDPTQARRMGDAIADAVSQQVYTVLRKESSSRQNNFA